MFFNVEKNKKEDASNTNGAEFHQLYKSILCNAENNKDSLIDANFLISIQGLPFEMVLNAALMMDNTVNKDSKDHIPVEQGLFLPIGCGYTANGFCKLMTGRNMSTAIHHDLSRPITKLHDELMTNLPKLVRIDVPGHSYVMLATHQKENECYGYIYQSNVAKGTNNQAFSLVSWLKDKKCTCINLSSHITQVQQLFDPKTSIEKKKELYKELYLLTPTSTELVNVNLDQLTKQEETDERRPMYLATQVSLDKMSTLILLYKQLAGMHLNSEITLTEYIELAKEEYIKTLDLNNQFNSKI
ncbi:hypothetical protein Lgra_1485 [Legionella gratiana]|uniref:Uncharacterized protein n=1 Tax=Legionella gratiana TaxID=45066 RepID=A0A378JFW9_9GAMM|nr:hypothetical protein [Legionella gratiana]KTD12027.1 hypothetical protein Lgra_1485 [Legionella gratiana]STX46369.1 Uncharacterised protein [Legionella gratiana]